MLAGLNRALDMVETTSGEPVDVASMARVALTSEHHLRRLFTSLAGMPLSEYIRRRRMSLAATEIAGSTEPLLDIAIRYGYGSGEAFARAFRAQHGISPSEARLKGATLTTQPRMVFTLRIEGKNEMQYQIVEKPEWRIVGYRKRLHLIYQGVNNEMEEFYNGLSDDDWAQLDELPNGEPTGILTVSTGFEPDREDGSLFDCWIAVATNGQPLPGMDELIVPAGTWLVLPYTGREYPDGIQQLWIEATDWFSSHPQYRSATGPEVLSANWSDDETTASGELWLPIERAI